VCVLAASYYFLSGKPQSRHVGRARVPGEHDYSVETVTFQFGQNVSGDVVKRVELYGDSAWKVAASVADALPKRGRHEATGFPRDLQRDVFSL
jgi:hypothetical protein